MATVGLVVGALGALVVLGAAGALLFVGRAVVVTPPGCVALIAGRGETPRVVTTGRAWRLPLLERVEIVSVPPTSVECTVSRAFTVSDGVAHVDVGVVVALAPDPDSARLVAGWRLGDSAEHVATVARGVIETVTRRVLAGISPDVPGLTAPEVTRPLATELDHEFAKLGLTVLSGPSIRRVWQTDHETAAGRHRAELLRQERAGALESAAHDAAMRQIERDEARAVAKERAAVSAERVRLDGLRALESERLEWQRLRHEAELLAPAQARAAAAEAEARAGAAALRATGTALADVARRFIDGPPPTEEGPAGGPLVDHLPELTGRLVDVWRRMPLDPLASLVAGGGDDGGALEHLPSSVARLREQLEWVGGELLAGLSDRDPPVRRVSVEDDELSG